MRRTYNRKKTTRRRIKFFGTVIVSMILVWFGYHATTYFPKNKKVVSDKSPDTSVEQIASVVKPQVNQPLSEQVDEELPLLAGLKKKKTVTTRQSERSEKPLQDVALPSSETSGQKEILAQANDLANKGKTIEARTLLSDYLEKNFDNASSLSVRDRALELGKQTILSLKAYPGDTLCDYRKIEAGDTFLRFSKKCKVPYQFLCHVNQISDPTRLMEGQRVKLVKGPIHFKVISHELTMYVFLQDTLFAKYKVGLGKNDKTPFGKWIVEDRIRKPVYKDPDTGEIFGPNDKDNPTGGYWVRLKGVEGATVGRVGFGIHGTNEPDSIGKFMSKGCIRVKTEEMAEVFNMISPGNTEVWTLQ